jgi:hypothetical protein
LTSLLTIYTPDNSLASGREVEMKRLLPVLAILMLCVGACEYQEPLSVNQNIPIDPALLGLWQPMPDKNESVPTDEWLLALKYSDTEYLVQYKTGSESMYFRAYSIKIGDTSCIQLQLIGYSDTPIKKGDPAYQVALVTLNGDEVTVRMLNTSVVNASLRGAELREAFLKNSKNSGLFREPGKFKRIKKG